MTDHLKSPEQIAALEQEGAKLLKEYQHRLAVVLMKDQPNEIELQKRVADYLSQEPVSELVEVYKKMNGGIYFPSCFIEAEDESYNQAENEIYMIATPFSDKDDPALPEGGKELRQEMHEVLGEAHLLHLRSSLAEMRAQTLLWEKYHPGEDPVKNVKKAFASELADTLHDTFTSEKDPLLAELALLFGSRDGLLDETKLSQNIHTFAVETRMTEVEDNLLEDGVHPRMVHKGIAKYLREEKVEEKMETMKKNRKKLYEKYKEAPKPLGHLIDLALETKNGELPVHLK